MTVVLNKKNKKPELLAPAGSMEKLRIALLYGADAVYIGGTEFGLRAYASNFDIAEIAEAAAFAHELGKKVYVTVNIFAHNNDIERLSDYLREIAAAGVDAIIVSDLGVFDIAIDDCPALEGLDGVAFQAHGCLPARDKFHDLDRRGTKINAQQRR